jgi:hypothetical protein
MTRNALQQRRIVTMTFVQPPAVSREMQTYESALPRLLEDHEGEFVVILGTKLLRYFPTYSEAVTWGYERFGLDHFFVKRIAEDGNTVHFTRDLGPCPN